MRLFGKILFCTVLFFAVISCSNKLMSTFETGGQNMMGNDEKLVLAAKNIIVKEGVDVADCNTKIVTENHFTIVEFYPKNPRQFGGGRVIFEKENDQYKFIKVELWQ